MEEQGRRHGDVGAGTEAQDKPQGSRGGAAAMPARQQGWWRGSAAGGHRVHGWPPLRACQAGVVGAGGQCRVQVRGCAGDPCCGLLCPSGAVSCAHATLGSGTDSCTARPSWVLRPPVHGLCQPDHSRTAPKDAQRLGRNKSSLCFLLAFRKAGIDLRFCEERLPLRGTSLLRPQPHRESGQGRRKTCEFAGRSHF